jgi:large subunit ribosomal protein L17
LQNKEAIKELFGTVAEKVADRPGGYVRIIKLGFRRSDGTDMAMIELVDFNEVYNVKSTNDSAKKKTRRGRRTGSTVTAVAAPVAAATAVVADVVEETPAVEEAPAADTTSGDATPAE